MAELRASFEELKAMVASARTWNSVLRRLLAVDRSALLGRGEARRPSGPDGETYAWTRLIVCEVRDGRFASVCQFDAEDEEAAFAYAEERMRATGPADSRSGTAPAR